MWTDGVLDDVGRKHWSNQIWSKLFQQHPCKRQLIVAKYICCLQTNTRLGRKTVTNNHARPSNRVFKLIRRVASNNVGWYWTSTLNDVGRKHWPNQIRSSNSNQHHPTGCSNWSTICCVQPCWIVLDQHLERCGSKHWSIQICSNIVKQGVQLIQHVEPTFWIRFRWTFIMLRGMHFTGGIFHISL